MGVAKPTILELEMMRKLVVLGDQEEKRADSC
jgi:hypothetical protein